ncbi:hypothetical protein [Streptomyces phaeochromogenes]|uniref:hypothetical protein n=1 Tax=Streptomyces phaeochromogenes TaxID=1923 RepID=UPI0036D0D0C5
MPRTIAPVVWGGVVRRRMPWWRLDVQVGDVRTSRHDPQFRPSARQASVCVLPSSRVVRTSGIPAHLV